MKKLTSLFFALLCITNTAVAQVTTVEGVGVDKDSAVRDAMRNAVENVVGTFIDSRTLVDKSVVALDEVYAKSQGFVKNIKVLREGQSGSEYKVTAQIDVDTNPDSQLMDRLNMIMLLNDPRIAVVVLKNDLSSQETTVGEDFDAGLAYTDNAAQSKNSEIIETAFNEKLIDLGFSHVVDANLVAKLKNSNLLNSIYNGNTQLVESIDNFGVDYLVLGKSTTTAERIRLPNKEGAYTDTNLTTGRVNLNVKIIKFSTGDIVEAFSTDGQAVSNGADNARLAASQNAAKEAAKKLEVRFKKIGAKTVINGIQLLVAADDESIIEELIGDLRSMQGINNIYVREKNRVKVVLEIDSSQKPHVIIQMLKQSSKLSIFVEKMSNDSVEVSVS